MNCAITVAVVVFYLALVSSQTIPPSTNPEGFTYFSPSVVADLALNRTVSGTIYTSTDNVYNQYWRVWIPPNVGGVKYTLNNTSPSSINNYVYISINFVYGRQDISNGFSCAYSDSATSIGMPACLNADAYWGASSGDEASDTYTAGDDFIPGNWHYITVNKYYDDSNSLNYTLSLESTFECPPNNAVGVYSSYYLYCFDNTVIRNVTQSGQSFSGVIADQNQQVYFRVNPPQNTSRVWAWITSNAGAASIYACEGYICTYSYDAMEYVYTWVSYNSTAQTYNYYLEMDLPDSATPVYYTLGASYQNTAYSVQFLWSACGASYAGYGVIQHDPYTPNSTFSIPDCADPVSYKNIVEPFSSVTFSVPAYNSTTDNYAAAAYGYMYIQTTSVGILNISCSSTADGSFFVMSKGSLTDCQTYTYFRYCSGPTYSPEYLTMLSEDLYPGGYFSIAVCSKETNPVTIVFNPGGSVVLPSPSPTPSMSPAMSPSPSAAPDSDSSVGPVIPALVIIGLAIMTILF